MMTKKWLVVLLVICTSFCTAQEAVLKQGMRISKSLKIKKGVYLVEAPVDTSLAVIQIEGNNLVIDFNEAELRGGAGKLPNAFYGVAIRIRNSKNVTIRNLSARGYKIALLARNVEGLTIENCDFSYNYRQHLNSTQEKEDISDWMSYHHNEKDEWLRYGAAMYLRDCDKAEVRNCRVTGGQNGLMLTQCDSVKVVNNDISFNSGIGIGMYRSSYGLLYYNKLMFNVRGYSHGVYNRGQDSAGFLVFEQCGNNIFYKNNVTHGGDGFFLWAGQYTMDTGEGGCNDNLLYGNDFSYAPTNGIEVTFSRNQIIQNILRECDHGIWGGYSFGTTIRNNRIEENRIGVAIEHGQENTIYMNTFRKNGEGIKLWSRKTQPADWVYAQKRDTRSHNVNITNNFFMQNGRALNLRYTDSITLAENFMDKREADELLNDSTLTNWGTVYRNDSLARPFMEETRFNWPPELSLEKPHYPVTEDRYAGRKNIRITEWGPYDFRSPIIWNTNPTDTSGLMKFEILGPSGKWKVRSYTGVGELSAFSGVIPASITARKLAGPRTDIRIELDYTGEESISPFGEVVKAGRPAAFHFRKFFQPVKWEVDWFSYDSLSDLIKRPEAMYQLNKQPVLKHEITDRLDYAWWGGIRAGEKQYPHFFTLARGQADFLPGDYELSVTWDDAVRVYLDGKLLIDEWQPSKYTFDESPNRKIKIHLAGNHNFKVEHVELNGFATLALKLRRLD